MKNDRIVSVAQVRVDSIGRELVLRQIDQSLNSDTGFRAIHTLNPEILMHAYHSPEYAKVLNKGDFNVVDGIGLKLAVKFRLGISIDRICGSDLIFDLAEMAEKKNRSLLLLGGSPARLEKAKCALGTLHPNLTVITFSPAYGTQLPLHEQQKIEELIKKNRPCVVAVCLGAPRQEMWIAQNRDLLCTSDVRVAAGLGGVVDFLSGDIVRAPKWIRAIGMEWAFRLASEPSRIKRQFGALPKFVVWAIFNNKFVRFGGRKVA